MQGIWLALFILQWALLLLLVVLNLGILRYLAALQEQAKNRRAGRSKFQLGEQVSNFTLPTIQKDMFSSKSMFDQNKRVLLFFLSTKCGSCKTMIEQIGELARRPDGLQATGWNFILIFNGELSATQKMAEDLPLADLTVLIDQNASIARDYNIPSTPFAMAIDRSGNLYSQSSQPASRWLYTVIDIPAPVDSAINYDQSLVPTLMRTTLG